MSFSIQAPDSMGSGGFLTEEGWYHVVIAEVREGTDSKGEIIKGGGFSCEIQEVSTGRKRDLTFRNGDETAKDKGEFARKKQLAFLLATNLVGTDALGKSISVDLQNATGAQVCVELRKGKPTDKGKVYLDLHYANIFHVDDPHAKDVAKDETSLAQIDPKHRHEAAWFEPLYGKAKEKKVGGGSGKSSAVTDDDLNGI